jgi:hypothetical protein
VHAHVTHNIFWGDINDSTRKTKSTLFIKLNDAYDIGKVVEITAHGCLSLNDERVQSSRTAHLIKASWGGALSTGIKWWHHP